MTTSAPFDLDAYLARIGLPRPAAADVAALRRLHAAHLARIPFENLDVRLKRPVGLDLESLQAGLVRRRRGGYCFQQNTLFAAALAALGFEVDTLEARVRPPGAPGPLPRTHMVLRVTIEGAPWLADVGFGGEGPLYPVPLGGAPMDEPAGTYRIEEEPGRIEEEPGVHVLRLGAGGTWRDLYAFTLAPALPVDYEVAHHYTSTHPRSPFVNTLTVQRTTPERRQMLRGRLYVEQAGERETRRELTDEEVVRLVIEEIGLDVPAEDVVRALSDRTG